MRRTQHTILLVCEGYAEDELARVMRDLYLPRGCGTALRATNGRGYGAAHALELAIQHKRDAAYDSYGILIDTDQHWTDADRLRARQSGIIAIENVPCLEATLLQVDGARAYQQTRENKAAFEEAYGGPAHRDGIIRRNFSREQFDAARARLKAIDDLLRLMQIAP